MINQRNRVGFAGLRREIIKLKNPVRAEALAWFFKTGPGQYGEGDKFLGLTVPVCRELAQKYSDLTQSDLSKLIDSSWHEERLIALLILVKKFTTAAPTEQKRIFDFYLRHTRFINNWDLVDLSAPHIVGRYLRDRPRTILFRLASSKNLWERRIAMVTTYTFIRTGDFTDALKIAKTLLPDKHDLVHKAVGWMLREVEVNGGKEVLLKFLKENYDHLPRTTLRYAIEHFPETKRKKLLAGNFK